MIAHSCTAYGQAGSRVTGPERHRPRPGHRAGALTVLVATQIANHPPASAFWRQLPGHRPGGMVYAGNNDVFT